MTKNLNDYIKKSHIKAVEKLNQDLMAFAKETGEDIATLYENANMRFTLSGLSVENGKLCYMFDGKREEDPVVEQDELTGEYVEDELYGIMDSVKFWRKCLNRAKRYWAMDPDKLDAIQDGEVEDDEEEEEE